MTRFGNESVARASMYQMSTVIPCAVFVLVSAAQAASLITCSVIDRTSGQVIDSRSTNGNALTCMAPDMTTARISYDPGAATAGTTGVRSVFDLAIPTSASSPTYDVVADLTFSEMSLASLAAIGGTGPALLDFGQPFFLRESSGSVTFSPVPTSVTLQGSVSVGSWPGPLGPGDYRNCPVFGGPLGVCYLPITFGVPFPV
jgi:hypothetical protein